MDSNQILANRTIALNAMHTWINKVAPIIKEVISDNDLRFKVDGGFYAKSKELLDNSIDTSLMHSSYFKKEANSEYISLHNKIRYNTGDYSCNYYDVSIYFNSETGEYQPIDLPVYEIEEMIAAKKRLSELKDQETEIRNESARLRRMLGL